MHRTVNSDIFVRPEAEQVELQGQKEHSHHYTPWKTPAVSYGPACASAGEAAPWQLRLSLNIRCTEGLAHHPTNAIMLFLEGEED